ncbi:hypothetical protein [Streptosporangium sp. NPDC002721]|uniref:hypothetical protein n=1 Tax=Streptosporangium sp. NPDC002721 TaxID=3366188 RepID=UPI0036B42275
METSRAPLLAWFGHPATVVATFVLLINDHLLKALWPGLVTGKLSDVAGLLVAPPVLALVLSPGLALSRTGSSPVRARLVALVAIAATGVGFTLVKTTEAGAELASRAWTLVAGPSLVLADPTDLVALPALGAAWLVWRRCGAGHPARRVRALVIVPVALVGVTATSAEPGPPAATQVFVRGEAITVVMDHETEIVSSDGGRTWAALPVREQGPRSLPPSDPPESSPLPDVASPSPSPGLAEPGSSSVPDRVTRACLPDEPAHCYRVVPPRLAVDESRDGGAGWDTVWAVSEGRQGALQRRTEERWSRSWQGSSAIAVQRVPDGHVVVAANGDDGIVVRDARGNWRRMGLSDGGFSANAAIPLDAPGVGLATEHRIGLFVGLLGFMSGMAVARRHVRRNPGMTVFAHVLAAVGFVLALPSGGRSHDLIDFGVLVAALGGFCALVATLLVALAAIIARVPARTWLALVVIASCTPLSMWMLFTGWESGVIDDYSTVGFLAWLVGGAGVGASVLVGWAGPAGAEGAGETGEMEGRPA